ncbi:MAG: diguanylate cyclase [archaeon]|nr:diguanylate cyclase [archaeon]
MHPRPKRAVKVGRFLVGRKKVSISDKRKKLSANPNSINSEKPRPNYGIRVNKDTGETYIRVPVRTTYLGRTASRLFERGHSISMRKIEALMERVESGVAASEEVIRLLSMQQKLHFYMKPRLVELIRRAVYDSDFPEILTKTAFEEMAQDRLLNKNSPHILCMIDVDDLKLINTFIDHTHGHRVVKIFAEALAETFVKRKRELNGLVGRFGGDEFSIYNSLGADEFKKLLDEDFRLLVRRNLLADDYLNSKIRVSLAEFKNIEERKSRGESLSEKEEKFYQDLKDFIPRRIRAGVLTESFCAGIVPVVGTRTRKFQVLHEQASHLMNGGKLTRQKNKIIKAI